MVVLTLLLRLVARHAQIDADVPVVGQVRLDDVAQVDTCDRPLGAATPTATVVMSAARTRAAMERLRIGIYSGHSINAARNGLLTGCPLPQVPSPSSPSEATRSTDDICGRGDTSAPAHVGASVLRSCLPC